MLYESDYFTEVEDVDELIEGLSEGIVHFAYRKQDGSIRVAFGTLNKDFLDNLPIVHPSRSRRRTDNEEFQLYYDVEKDAWRNFYKKNLIGINFNYGI